MRLVINPCLAFDNHVRFQTHLVTEDYLIADNAKRANEMIGPDLSLSADNSAFVNKGRHCKRAIRTDQGLAPLEWFEFLAYDPFLGEAK